MRMVVEREHYEFVHQVCVCVCACVHMCVYNQTQPHTCSLTLHMSPPLLHHPLLARAQACLWYAKHRNVSVAFEESKEAHAPPIRPPAPQPLQQ